MVEPQVRFNSYRSKMPPHNVEWFFFIIENPKGMKKTLARVYSTCSSIAREYDGVEGTVDNSDLIYNLVHFECKSKVDNLSGIAEEMVRDSNLDERKGRELSDYVKSLINSA